MSEAVDILMRLRGGKTAARETKQVGDEIGRMGRKARTSGEQAHHSGKNYEFATQRLHLFGRAAIGARERTLGLATAALGVTGAMFGVEEVVRSSVDAWRTQRRISAETAAAITSTGGAAHISAKHLDEMSRALQKTTGIDHGDIQSAGNTLLRMINVRGKIYDRALRTITDVSAGRHIGLEAASLAVGKALDNPAKGMTRLQRLGISLSDTQQQQIKTFSAFGDTAKAQDIILGALNKRFAGTAKAVATPGMKLKATFTDLKESIGRGLQPAVDAVDRDLLHLADKAMPYVTKAADDVGKIFNRKDLTTGKKLGLAFRVTRRDMAPLFRDIRREVKNWHVEKRIQDAISWAAPIIANSAAHAVPKIIGAFWHAFRKSDVWGKIAILGFITWKFGVIRSIGGSVASALAGGIAGRLAATETGAAIAASLGTSAESAGVMASAAAAGGAIGAALGVGVATALGVYLSTHIQDALNHSIDKLPGPIRKYLQTVWRLTPVGQAVQTGHALGKSVSDAVHGHPSKIPGDLAGAIPLNPFGIHHGHHKVDTSGVKASPFHPTTRIGELPKPKRRPQHGRHTQGFRLDSPHPSLHGVLTIHNHHHLYVDGKEMTAVLAPNLAKGNNPRWVSAAIGKDTADRKARR